MSHIVGAEALCRTLCEDLGSVVKWKWDGRFATVLAEFSMDGKDPIRAVLETHLPSAWDRSTFCRAPAHVAATAARLGGLMAGQLLLTSAPSDGVGIYCAWWPWGNGKMISIRLGVFHEEEGRGDDEEARLKSWFGLAGSCS